MKITMEALRQMQERGGSWAAYQNVALDSAGAGHIQFLKVGPDCTFKTPPKRCPDTPSGLGWKYSYVGMVNLLTGEIEVK